MLCLHFTLIQSLLKTFTIHIKLYNIIGIIFQIWIYGRLGGAIQYIIQKLSRFDCFIEYLCLEYTLNNFSVLFLLLCQGKVWRYLIKKLFYYATNLEVKL